MTLEQNDDEQIDLFDWTCSAARDADAAEDKAEELSQKLQEQETQISKLKEQLRGLTEARLEYENALLQNFGELLNSKKLKIRDQQRLLSGAKVDPSAGT